MPLVALARLVLAIVVLGLFPRPVRAQVPLGPYHVGYRAFSQYDYSRSYLRGYDANGDTVTGSHARPIQTSLWYPAVLSSRSHRLTYTDYMMEYALVQGPAPLDSAHRHAALVQAALEFGWPLADFEKRIAIPANAYGDAMPAAGRFPVIIYSASSDSYSMENAELYELLASHGYVVVASSVLGAFVRWPGEGLESAETEARDMEFLIAYAHTLPYVDASRLGVMGYSWGGLADVIVALRNPTVRAVVGLDGSIKYWYYLIKDQPYGDPSAYTAPSLFLAWNDSTFTFYDSIQHADAYYIALTKLTHGNFASEANYFIGPDQRALWHSDSATVDRSFDIAERYVLNFLNAYLKGDASGRAFLARSPEANGAPPGWVVATSKKASPGPGDVPAFVHYVMAHGGWSHAGDALVAIRRTDSAYNLPVGDLGRLGFDYSLANRNADALAVLEVNVALHPKSAEAQSALGDSYFLANDTAHAVASYQKAVALDSASTQAVAMLKYLHKP